MTFRFLIAALLAAILVMAGTVIFLSNGVPDQTSSSIQYPTTSFNFAIGSGQITEDNILVDVFTNGYALLSTGPINILANSQRVLNYTWLPSTLPREASFFWRRSDTPQSVFKTEITLSGTQLIDLATETEWQGEITELGFLFAGVNGEVVELGHASLMPDTLASRLQLTWRAWTVFEPWSQQSINFLHGGDYRQIIALPQLFLIWSISTIFLLLLFSWIDNKTNPRQLLISTGLIFLVAWVLLDTRWSANNLRQIQRSFQTHWASDETQRFKFELDSEIHQYTQRLKSKFLGEKPARILIVSDENVVDYNLLRAKYHLLPHSVAVSHRLAKPLTPRSLDFVISYGQSTNITKLDGWSPSWRNSLIEIDRSRWGVVYRIR